MPEPTLYLFDGNNLLHAGRIQRREELIDRLAGFAALRGARGVVVFDGVGDDRSVGALEVRFAPHADELIERIAAETRGRERVCVVSSDRAIAGTSGQEARHLSSRVFLGQLDAVEQYERSGATSGSRIEDALDSDTRSRLERWRRSR